MDRLAIDVDVEPRKAEERADESDGRDGDEERRESTGPVDAQPDRSDGRDRDDREQRADPAAEALLLVEVAQRPIQTGLRRSMNARTPSRKSSLV